MSSTFPLNSYKVKGSLFIQEPSPHTLNEHSIAFGETLEGASHQAVELGKWFLEKYDAVQIASRDIAFL